MHVHQNWKQYMLTRHTSSKSCKIPFIRIDEASLKFCPLTLASHYDPVYMMKTTNSLLLYRTNFTYSTSENCDSNIVFVSNKHTASYLSFP